MKTIYSKRKLRFVQGTWSGINSRVRFPKEILKSHENIVKFRTAEMNIL